MFLLPHLNPRGHQFHLRPTLLLEAGEEKGDLDLQGGIDREEKTSKNKTASLPHRKAGCSSLFNAEAVLTSRAGPSPGR